ncbi:hypothetical protein DFH94DRAFT_759255 [Russula ochroleuca]|jgi:hypothetical protein|uniref:Uncharacterized protein n=1 Tax=Russula ochroleuca TaxID=152965 RepID=A0A9P5T6A4_9AGAM|nr:hypothetical protein DFH94DRAFT_759255 [Russula ochroleuca]
MHDPMLVNDLEREAPRPTHLPQPDTRCDRLRGGDCLRQRRFLARVPLPLHREQLMDDGHDVLPAAPPPYLPPCSWHWMECATRSGGCLEEIGQYVTLGNIRRLRKMICYLVAWLLLSHGISFLPNSACITEVCLFRVHNTHLDSAAFRKDNTSYTTELSRTRVCTHTKCRYPRRATIADPPTSPQPRVPACARITHCRRQHHSVIWRHRAVRTA